MIREFASKILSLASATAPLHLLSGCEAMHAHVYTSLRLRCTPVGTHLRSRDCSRSDLPPLFTSLRAPGKPSRFFPPLSFSLPLSLYFSFSLSLSLSLPLSTLSTLPTAPLLVFPFLLFLLFYVSYLPRLLPSFRSLPRSASSLPRRCELKRAFHPSPIGLREGFQPRPLGTVLNLKLCMTRIYLWPVAFDCLLSDSSRNSREVFGRKC